MRQVKARGTEAAGANPSQPESRRKRLSIHAAVIQLGGREKRSAGVGRCSESGLKKEIGTDYLIDRGKAAHEARPEDAF